MKNIQTTQEKKRKLNKLIDYLSGDIYQKSIVLLEQDKKTKKWRPFREYRDSDRFVYPLNNDPLNMVDYHLSNNKQIGLYLPNSNFVVLDFDDEQEYKQFTNEYGTYNTYTVQTNRGYHLYFLTDNKYKKQTPMQDFYKSNDIDKYNHIDLLPSQKGYIRLFFNDDDRFVINDTKPIKLPNELEKKLIPYLEKKQEYTPTTSEHANSDYNINFDNLSQIISELAPYLIDCNYNDWFNFSSNLAMLIKSINGDYSQYMDLVKIYDNGKGNQSYYLSYWNNRDNSTIQDIAFNSTVISNFYNKVLNKIAPPIHTLANENNELLNHYKNVNYLGSGEYIKTSHIVEHMQMVKKNKCDNSLFLSSVGTGKTTAFIDYAFKCNKRVMFVVPTIQLVKDLASKEKYKNNDKIGFFYGRTNSLKNTPKHIIDGYQVIILTIDQTKHLDHKIGDLEQYQIYKPFDLCVLDEMHIYSVFAEISESKKNIIYDFLYNDKYKKLINHSLLLTATPFNLPPFKCVSNYIKPLNKNVNLCISDEYTHPNSPNRRKDGKVNYYLEFLNQVIKVYDIKPNTKNLVFTNNNSLIVDNLISDELVKKGYTTHVIHSKTIKKNIANNPNYQFSNFNIASSILNVGIDFFENFDNIIIIDNYDINYILQALNRDRSLKTNVYICLQNKQNKKPFKLPELHNVFSNDNDELKRLMSDNILTYLNDEHTELTNKIIVYKVINDYYKNYIKHSLNHHNIMEILDLLKISYKVNYKDFKGITYKSNKKADKLEKVKDLEYKNITDYISYELVNGQVIEKFSKSEKQNITDNSYLFARYRIAEKVKGTNLEKQFNKLSEYINKLCIHTRPLKHINQVDEVMRHIEVLYNNPYLIEKCDLFSLVINVYELANNNTDISNLVHNKANIKLSALEHKELLKDIKNKSTFNIDDISNKTINDYIKSLGYEVVKKRTKKDRYIILEKTK